MKWAIIATVVLIVFGFIPGLGLPGACMLVTTQFPAEQLLTLAGIKFKGLEGDRAWPACIFMTLICPLAIVPAYLVSFRKLKELALPAKIVLFLAVIWVWGLLITLALEGIP